MIDDDEESLLEQLGDLSTDELRAVAAERWATCRSGSLALGLAERLAPRDAFVAAAVACARFALPARSRPEPVLARALDTALACARGDAAPEDARRASDAAWATISQHVAGVDDDVGLAVAEACDLAAGDRFDPGGADPAGRAAWAWAWRRCGGAAARADVEAMDRAVQRELAETVRAAIPALP